MNNNIVLLNHNNILLKYDIYMVINYNERIITYVFKVTLNIVNKTYLYLSY